MNISFLWYKVEIWALGEGRISQERMLGRSWMTRGSIDALRPDH
jgi:hypothetical protein